MSSLITSLRLHLFLYKCRWVRVEPQAFMQLLSLQVLQTLIKTESQQIYVMMNSSYYQVAVSLRNKNGDTQPFVVYYGFLANNFIVCNDQPHTVYVSTTDAGVSIKVSHCMASFMDEPRHSAHSLSSRWMI